MSISNSTSLSEEMRGKLEMANAIWITGCSIGIQIALTSGATSALAINVIMTIGRLYYENCHWSPQARRMIQQASLHNPETSTINPQNSMFEENLSPPESENTYRWNSTNGTIEPLVNESVS